MSEELDTNVETKSYRGYLLPGPKFFKEEDIEASINYRPRDGDIILCSFPKTGNTWVTYIIWLILHEEPNASADKETNINVPFMERSGIKHVEDLHPPRFYKNHFHYGLMKINEKAKYIYTYRRPDDTAVSFYYFLQDRTGMAANFDAFFAKFLKGILPYGDYFDHVLAAYAHKDDGHFLMVSYEDMKENPRNEIFRIAKFLGDGYYEKLKTSETFVQKILEKTTFDYMKNNLKTSLPIPGKDGKDGRIACFRKGVVGEGKVMLNEEQKNQIREKIKEKMKGTELLEKWL